jgi:hypothetical protein
MGFRWTLQDPSTAETYTFEINPNQSTMLTLQKQVNFYSTAAEDGSTVLYEGRDTPQKFSLTISVLYEDQLWNLQYWYSKRIQVLLTDDLGRTCWVYFTDFQPTRKYSMQHPWRHDVVMMGYATGNQVGSLVPAGGFVTAPVVGNTTPVAEGGADPAFQAYTPES